MPDWHSMIKVNLSFQGLEDRHLAVRWDDCKKWFKENIEGKYLVDESDLVEVSGLYNKFDHFNISTERYENDTHKAYLIKSSIEPIKKESEADILRDFIRGAEEAKQTLTMDSFIDHFKERAKAVLERDGE